MTAEHPKMTVLSWHPNIQWIIRIFPAKLTSIGIYHMFKQTHFVAWFVAFLLPSSLASSQFPAPFAHVSSCSIFTGLHPTIKTHLQQVQSWGSWGEFAPAVGAGDPLFVLHTPPTVQAVLVEAVVAWQDSPLTGPSFRGRKANAAQLSSLLLLLLPEVHD